MKMSIEQMLRAVPFFSQLPGELIQKLEKSGTIEQLSAGHIICREGDETNSMYLILQGKVKVVKRDAQGTEIEMAILESGNLLGELAFLDNKPRSADAVCKTPVEIFLLEQDTFLKASEC